MNSALLIGGVVAIACFAIWLAIRRAARQGVAEQVARDAQVVSQVESEIHQAQTEQRDTKKTKERLKGGTF